jgi:hypothetical protein
MTVITWVGVGTFVVLVLFLLVVYFFPPKDHGQYVVLRLIAMVLAGVSGGILSGEMTLQFSGAVSDFGKLAGSASGALGLLVLIWFTFPRPPDQRVDRSAAGSISIAFPANTKFRQAAEIIARIDNGSVSLKGFEPQEEATQLSFFNLRERSKVAAFRRLADLVPQNKIRPYEVRESGAHFDLIAKSRN